MRAALLELVGSYDNVAAGFPPKKTGRLSWLEVKEQPYEIILSRVHSTCLCLCRLSPHRERRCPAARAFKNWLQFYMF